MKIVDEAVLDVFRWAGRCEICRKRGPTEPHHVYCRGVGGGGRLDICENLLALCRPCHGAIDKMPRDEQLGIIARRERLSVEDIKDKINLLRRTRRS